MSNEQTDISFELGPADDFDSTPSEVEIEGKRFFLGRRDGELKLLSSLCPHRGGPVLSTGDRLECPLHEWAFDATTGEALGCEGDGLEAYDVDDEDGVLQVRLPREAVELAHPARPTPTRTDDDPDFELSPQTIIGDILDQLGEPAIDLFHQFGFACLGCALADEEPVRRAAVRHGLSPGEMRDLLEQLRVVRDTKTPNPD